MTSTAPSAWYDSKKGDKLLCRISESSCNAENSRGCYPSPNSLNFLSALAVRVVMIGTGERVPLALALGQGGKGDVHEKPSYPPIPHRPEPGLPPPRRPAERRMEAI